VSVAFSAGFESSQVVQLTCLRILRNDLVVSRIAPLYPDAEEFKKVPAGWIPRHGSVDERRAATARLRRHFRRMGFEHIRGTRFQGLSMARVVPTLEDLLRPGGELCGLLDSKPSPAGRVGPANQ
jgi:hypothetical protein